jgi:hypothetical protein
LIQSIATEASLQRCKNVSEKRNYLEWHMRQAVAPMTDTQIRGFAWGKVMNRYHKSLFFGVREVVHRFP